MAAVGSTLWHDMQTPYLRARFTTLLHSSIRALQCKVRPLTTTYIQSISPVVLLRVDIDRQQLRRLCLGPQPFCGKSALGHHSIYSRPPKPQPNICFRSDLEIDFYLTVVRIKPGCPTKIPGSLYPASPSSFLSNKANFLRHGKSREL